MILYHEMTWDAYRPHDDARELFDQICDEGKLDELESLIDEMYDGGMIEEGQLDDLLRFEDDWVRDRLDLEEEEEEEEDDEDDYAGDDPDEEDDDDV